MVRKQLVRKRGGHVQRRGGHVKSQNAQEHPPGKQNSTSEARGKHVKYVRYARKRQDTSVTRAVSVGRAWGGGWRDRGSMVGIFICLILL